MELDAQPPGGHDAPDLSQLGSKCLNLNSKINFISDSFIINILRSKINSGIYYFSANTLAAGGKFQLTPSEQHPVEGGGRCDTV